MTNLTSSLYVTYLEKEGPYIKVWGQTNRSLPMSIEKALQQMTPQFEEGMFLPGVEYFQVGPLCCAKFKDGSYYRARITNISYLMQGLVEVLFIDYGNKDIIPCVNTRTMTSISPGLISIPPQARPFILANVTLPGWNANLELISNELRYLEFQMIPVAEIGPYVLVSLFLEKQDITTNLLAHGLVTPTPLHMQQLVIQSLIERNSPPGIPVSLAQSTVPIQPKLPPGIPHPAVTMTTPAPTPTILTYKAMPMDHDCDYEVYVSYVSDGPCLFSVQLKKMEDQLKRLMTEINSMDLQQLEEYPLPGTVCLAQSTEDNYICRAVVTSMVDGLYKVFYVDFGNTELLSFDKLFQIPFKYVIPKVMATRFALAGVEQSTVSIEMKCAFKDFVNNKLLFMRVKPTAAKSALSLCDLWDDKNRKALDMIKQVALQSYAEPVSVSRGFSQDVKVSYVYSCNRFYIQLKSKESELSQLMDMLQEVCLSASSLSPTQMKDGYPCFALFEGDGLWYRAQVLSVETGSSYKVRYVDYGNEELVALENLREPHSELILALRPQAIECCLNGYQNMEVNEQRDGLLEELILEQEFSMKVVEVQDGRTLVDLSDSAHYNVASLLLDKIASVTSQISPLLVQDDYRIEHRKRTSPQPSFQKEREFKERKPSREFYDRNRETKQENWRQSKFSRNDDQRNDTNVFDKREAFRRATSSNDDQWEAETNNFEGQNSFQQTESRNDDEWDVDSKPSRTGRREMHQHTEIRNGDHQFEKPRTFEKRDRLNRSDSQQRGRFNQHEKQFSHRASDSEKPRRYEDSFQQKTQEKFNRTHNFKSFNEHNGSSDGYRQNRRNDFKREGSEKSFSDSSEKSWKKGGPKSYSKTRNSTGYARTSNFSKAPVVSASEDDWGATAVAEVLDLASETAQFKHIENLVGSNESVCISWFYNPINLFCQLTKYKNDFKTMMEEIQEKYSVRKTIKPVIGQPVIAKFEEDGVLYRAVVLSVDFNNYKVTYVDYGNAANVSSIYAIETKYMNMPAQALNCGLQNIGPSGENWPDPDAYSSYFNKESFECQFIYEVEERYFIELNNEGVRISTLLLEANLASSLQPDIEVDISLLPAQQMIVVLQDVTSLAELTIALEPNITMQASMHNLDGATETFEDTLRQYIGHFVIMFVDDVTEKGLEITLYDLTGQKLNIVSPDEGAYDTVDPVCALPIYTKTLKGWVSHATANVLYLQPSRFTEVLSQTLDLLYNHYETVAPEEALTPEIGVLYAVHSADTNWYRGRVTDLKDEGVVVTYIDYGNSESVPATELRMLHPKFYQPHMLAVEIVIDGVDCENFIGQEVTVSVNYGESEWTGQILSPIVTVTNETITEVPKSEDDSKNDLEPPVKSKPQVGVPVVLSHVDSPSEFYLQLVEAIEAIEFLQQSLQEQIPHLSTLENPTPGVLCAAPYSVNQQWYRAQVLDADDDITTVRFIDFGNTDVLSNTSTSIKTLPSDLLSVEQHSRLCSLFVKPIGAEWSSEAFSKFEEYASAELLSAEILHQDEKTTYVDLYADGKNVGEILKNDGFAVDLPKETESNSTGFISHLNSPSEFWIQLESSVPDLEWVAEQLSSAVNYPVLEDVAPGSLCAAVFPGDDSWYRARILSNTVAGLEVIFIDYGNSCSCMSVRELPEDLIMLPPLAHKCTLQKPPGILQWSQISSDKFREISADGATVFDVSILTPGEKSIVQLTLEGDDISFQLLPEVKDCIVSHIDSLDSIWIVMNEDTKKLEELTEILYQAETWPELLERKEGDLVAALYEDGLWYRAKILSKTEGGWEVIFVDYGNSTVSNFIRELAETCDSLPPLAVNCGLDILPQTRWADDSLNKFTELSAEGNTIFQMESAGENVVRLYLNGRDVRVDIGTIKNSPSTSRQSTPQKSRNTQLEGASKDEGFLISSSNNTQLKEPAKSLEDIIESEVIVLNAGNSAQSKVEVEVETENNRHFALKTVENIVTCAEEQIAANSIVKTKETCATDDFAITSPKTEDEAKEIEENQMNFDTAKVIIHEVEKTIVDDSAEKQIKANSIVGAKETLVTDVFAITSPKIEDEAKEIEENQMNFDAAKVIIHEVEKTIVDDSAEKQIKANSIVGTKETLITDDFAITSPKIEDEAGKFENQINVDAAEVITENVEKKPVVDDSPKKQIAANFIVETQEALVTDDFTIASPNVEDEAKEVEANQINVDATAAIKYNVENPNVDDSPITRSPKNKKETKVIQSAVGDSAIESTTNDSTILIPEVKDETEEFSHSSVDASTVKILEDSFEESINIVVKDAKIKDEIEEISQNSVDSTNIPNIEGEIKEISQSSAEISASSEVEDEEEKNNQKPADINEIDNNSELIVDDLEVTSPKIENKTKEVSESPVIAKKDSEIKILQSPVTDVSSDEFLDAKDESITSPYKPHSDDSPHEIKTVKTDDANNLEKQSKEAENLSSAVSPKHSTQVSGKMEIKTDSSNPVEKAD